MTRPRNGHLNHRPLHRFPSPADCPCLTTGRSVSACSTGGTPPGVKKDSRTIVCCTDAIRPVTFCIETEGEDDEAVV
ncbi:MAG: hypothetical protein HFF17_10640 [Oscillospiraceae bacterium]|nr:hypothetical protein [Oscillospiraceae bacterium]